MVEKHLIIWTQLQEVFLTGKSNYKISIADWVNLKDE